MKGRIEGAGVLKAHKDRLNDDAGCMMRDLGDEWKTNYTGCRLEWWAHEAGDRLGSSGSGLDFDVLSSPKL